jgi:hypothetical protein
MSASLTVAGVTQYKNSPSAIMLMLVNHYERVFKNAFLHRCDKKVILYMTPFFAHPLESPCRRAIVPLFYRKHRLTRHRKTAIRLFVSRVRGGGGGGVGGWGCYKKEKTTREICHAVWQRSVWAPFWDSKKTDGNQLQNHLSVIPKILLKHLISQC